jgi:hypothetical protein
MTLIDHADPIATLDLLDMTRSAHLAAQPHEIGPDALARLRLEAAGGLVRDKQGGAVDQ